MLTVSPDVLLLDNRGRGTLAIQNVGVNMLEGTIETTGWIAAEPTGEFRSNHLTVVVKGVPILGLLLSGDIGQVVIKSNGGDKTVQVRQ